MRSTLISLHPSRAFLPVSQSSGPKFTSFAGVASLTTLCALPLLIAPVSQAQAPAPPSASLPSPANNYGADVARNSMLTPRFEIEFQDIPVTDLLIQIAKLGNVEIAIRGDVGGTMKIVRYKNVTAEEAVERVASDAGLFWGKRADQYVVARILEDLPYEMQLKYRNAAQSGNTARNTSGNSGSSVSSGFAPPPVGAFDDFPPPPGGIALQGSPSGTMRLPNSENFQGIPELYRPEDAKKRNVSTNVIKIKNVTARMMAYWLDPANNAPDFATQRSNDAKNAASDERTLRPVGTFDDFGLLKSAYGNGPSSQGAYPYPAPSQQYGYPAGAYYGAPQYGAPQVAPYGMPYNTASPYVIGNSNGRPIYNGAPAQNSGRTQNTDFGWGGPLEWFPDKNSKQVKELLRQNNVWSSQVFNSNPWGQGPMIQARPQFGGRGQQGGQQGGRNQQGGQQGGAISKAVDKVDNNRTSASSICQLALILW